MAGTCGLYQQVEGTGFVGVLGKEGGNRNSYSRREGVIAPIFAGICEMGGAFLKKRKNNFLDVPRNSAVHSRAGTHFHAVCSPCVFIAGAAEATGALPVRVVFNPWQISA